MTADRPALPTGGAPAARPATVMQGGRAKAYRPLPLEARSTAIRAGLTAYEQGDFFEAHELLEPAWMGTDQPAERELVQGLIKLAAAYVHDVRGNPPGLEKNLRGARDRLAESLRLGVDGADGPGRAGASALPEPLAELDARAILAELDERLRTLREGHGAAKPAPTLHRLEDIQ